MIMRKKIYILLASLALVSCANRGIGPQGGPRDTLAPQPVRSEPENGALNFNRNRIEISFNEYLQLNNVSQNFLMSPPQQRPPDVKVRGKKVVVQFADTLRDNTTYTLDFGNAICDYRERNPFSNYSFAFSTGPQIDTLEVRGRVYEASNLNPQQGIIVGIHENKDDSAFLKMPFTRIGRTDSVGAFRIGNMQDGSYRLYAVNDISRDYRLTPGEALAYADSLLTPVVRPHYHKDSLGNDSLVGYEYGPADLELLLFEQQQKRLYLQRTHREQAHLIRVCFSSEPDSLPSFRAMRPSETDSTRSDSAWIDPMPYMHMHYSKLRDTVTIWLTDSAAISQDSIFLEARYRRTDSVYNLEWYTDTLRAIWRSPRLSAKAKKVLDRKNRERKLDLKSNARQGFELYDTLRINCSTPIASMERDSIHLYQQVDTIFKPVSFRIAPYDTLPMQLTLIASLGAGKKYELRIDSAALHDVYGAPNKAEKFGLQVKNPEEYATLRVKLNPFLPKARIQLLNNSDEPVLELPAVQGGTFFRYLKPQTYYMRLYIDENGDGLWTTGSWEHKRQPEPVYYFPAKIQTKSNWDFEEEWNYKAIPQMEAKPKELIRTGPTKKK
jgi:hypothetical protein